MDLKINASYLPQTDPDASLAFYRDVLGFEVRNDVGYEGLRWITVGPVGQPDTSIVLHPPQATPGITDAERDMILDLVTKGTFGINLGTADVDVTIAKIEGAGAEIVQEPIDQPYGIRDAAFRDPAGNEIRLQQHA
ncbi:MAG: VOC family protein [Solirubrobacteraceae bacterium]